jgi:hypothetical protein
MGTNPDLAPATQKSKEVLSVGQEGLLLLRFQPRSLAPLRNNEPSQCLL